MNVDDYGLRRLLIPDKRWAVVPEDGDEAVKIAGFREGAHTLGSVPRFPTGTDDETSTGRTGPAEYFA